MDELKEKTGFVIDDDSKAEWALRSILEAEAERDRLLALISAERSRLDEQQKAVMERYGQETEYLSSCLVQYMQTVKVRRTATRDSYKLLSGTLVYKHPRTEPSEAEGLAAWVEANHPEMMKVERKVAWGELKKMLAPVGDGTYVIRETGEIVEGVLEREVPGKFEVRKA